MTIEEMYRTLLVDAKSPDCTLYEKYRERIQSEIKEGLTTVPENDHRQVLPLNHDERIGYIRSRPCQYHSIVQLKELMDEFRKRLASYRARHIPDE